MKLYDKCTLQHPFLLGLDRYTSSRAYKNLVPNSAKCEKRSAKLVNREAKTRTARAFPGGITDRLFGFDFGKSAYDLLSKAPGPAGNQFVFLILAFFICIQCVPTR